MLKRILTGTALGVAIFAFFLARLLSPLFFEILIWLMTVIGTYEVARAMGPRLIPVQRWIPVFSAALVGPAYIWLGFSGVFFVFVAAIALQLLFAVIRHEAVTVEGLACAFLATFYPSLFTLGISAANALPAYSLQALLVVFIVSPCADTFAFFVGTAIKGPKLCPKVSPKKTVSGAIGGVLGGIVGAMGIYLACAFLAGQDVPPWWFFIIVGVVSSVLTEVGDLVESIVKRKLDIKDMGRILPGHGGVMDRIDGISFAAPFVYACFALAAFL